MLESQSVISEKFYVYELVDPRNGLPFYVGKGCGRRMYGHELEAARGHRSRKSSRILDICAAGLSVHYRVVNVHLDEEAAYEAEAARIVELGLENLTNVVPGGRGGYCALLNRARAWVGRGWRGSLHAALRYAFLSGCFKAPLEARIEFVDASGAVHPETWTVAEMRQLVASLIAEAIEVASAETVREWVLAQQAVWARGELRL